MPTIKLKSSRSRGALEVLAIQDFSGGWNPRDAPSEVAANESPDCINITLDERGGVVKRLGLYRLGSGSSISSAPVNSFYWPTATLAVIQDGATVRTTSDFVTFTSVNTFSTAGLMGFADFKGQLMIVHPVDGVYSYSTGGGLQGPFGSPVKGNSIAVWQNKLWVVGDTSNPSRVWWSNPGDEQTWSTATDYVDVREVDDAKLTAIGSGQMMDVTAKPTLLVFKEFSMHRINDSDTGSYTTLSTSEGASGPLAVTNMAGRTFFAGKSGIFGTDGVSVPTRVSAKLEPLFTSTQLNYAETDNWCMGVKGDRVLLSLTRTGSSINNLTLEYSPIFNWIVPHDFGVSSFMRWGKNDDICYGTSTTLGKVYQVFRGGSDDGTAIDSRFQTRWLEVNAGHEAQIRRMIVEGRDDFDLYVKKNYATGQGELNHVSIPGNGFVWDVDTWGDPAKPWGPAAYEDYQSFYSLGVCRSISFVMKHTGTVSTNAPKLLGDGASAEVGGFACYGITLEYVRLGYA